MFFAKLEENAKLEAKTQILAMGPSIEDVGNFTRFLTSPVSKFDHFFTPPQLKIADVLNGLSLFLEGKTKSN